VREILQAQFYGLAIPSPPFFLWRIPRLAGAVDTLAASVLEDYSKRFSRTGSAAFGSLRWRTGLPERMSSPIAAPSFHHGQESFALTTDDPFNKADAVLSHEVAHQWWAVHGIY